MIEQSFPMRDSRRNKTMKLQCILICVSYRIKKRLKQDIKNPVGQSVGNEGPFRIHQSKEVYLNLEVEGNGIINPF